MFQDSAMLRHGEVHSFDTLFEWVYFEDMTYEPTLALLSLALS